MATRPAIVGSNLRLGNFRLGYQPSPLPEIRVTRVNIFVAGVLANARVRHSSVSIRDVLNDAPNTCSLVLDGTPAPESGMALRILINSNAPRLLFNGTIETDDVTYEGKATQLAYPCSAIDDTARLNKRRPFGIWTNVSATTVAQELITSFAPGFTANHVEAGLPTITVEFDGSEGFSGCLRQIVKLIGGYFYVEDHDLHLFLTEASETPDTIDTTPRRFLNDPPITASSDDSQLRTRVYGRGHGSQLLVDIAVGETILAVADASGFTPGGGSVIASTIADGSLTERLTYTGVSLGGLGALVGPGVTPSASPIVVAVAGSGLGLGVYKYAYTFVTSVGETLPSPIASVTTTTGATDPSASLSLRNYVNFGTFNALFPIGEAHEYRYAYSTNVGLTDYSAVTLMNPTSVAIVTVSNQDVGNPTKAAPIIVTVPCSSDSRIKTIIVYQYTAAGGFVWRVGGSVANVVGGGTVDTTVANTTTTNPVHGGTNTTPGAQAVTIDGVALGPSGTTARKVYRSAVNATQLQLQQTIANNTSTSGGTDTTVDGSLGANIPTENTSGLTASVAVGGGFFKTSVTFATNGAATSATGASPVFTSASYTFVAADVGAFVYIKSGTNWLVGSYRIVSVAAGAATVAGPIATVASPTTGTWGVDYSAFTTARYSYTDLAIDATTATKVTSAAQPFGPNTVGNTLSVTGGVGFSVQNLVVVSVSGVIATCDKAVGTLSSTGGSGVLGVATAQPFVLAGATSISTSSPGPFSATGGWVRLSSAEDLVRYTGVTGNNLTGIPASGVGSILNSIPFNTPVTAVPALTGVTGATKALDTKAAIAVWVQRDDVAAQAAAVTRETTADYTSDGIHEHLIVDERRGEASLAALCDADLDRFGFPIVTVMYATRDVKTKSGKPIVVNLSSPPISQTLTIQDVTITEIDVAPALAPRFTVNASSVRFSLEDVLRRMSALLPE